MRFVKKRKAMSIPERSSPANSIPEKFRYGDESDDEEMNQHEIYTVEKVLAIRYTKNKRCPEYLLKWKNWPYNTSNWEMQKNISCEQLMTVFFARHRLRLLIASELNMPELPNFESLPSFYGCQIWEDEMNETLRDDGQAPLYVENWMDKASEPKRFTYITKNQIPPETQKLFRTLKGNYTHCLCTNGCGGSSATCCFKKPSLTAQGQLPEGFDGRKHLIVECSDQCVCDRNCPGRVIQRGRQIPVVIFRSPDRGWGIRAAAAISAKRFVMEYVGEVITIEEAEKRPFMYQFEIKTGKKSAFVIDSAHYGNESRFVNHSCEPNMVVEPVFSYSFDGRYNRYAFFACRDIEQGEELTINYQPYVDKAQVEILIKKHGMKPCLCKAEKCRGFFL